MPSPRAAPSSSDDDAPQNDNHHRRAATDPGPDEDASASLLATAGAALTSRRVAATRALRKAGKAPVAGRPLRPRPTSAGGVGSVPGGRRPGARLAPLGLTSDDDGAAAASLRSWLAALATAPAASRYAKHKVAVVRTALRLLEAQRYVRMSEREGGWMERDDLLLHIHSPSFSLCPPSTDAQDAQLRALLDGLTL